MLAITDDSLAVALLCTPLGLETDSEILPLTTAEWNRFVASVPGLLSEHPAELIGVSDPEIGKRLGCESAVAERIARLLGGSGRLAAAMARLEEAGIWMITRVDGVYPCRLRERLKERCPLVMFGAGDLRLLQNRGIAIVGSREMSPGAREFSAQAGAACAAAGLTVISGAARGIDRTAMAASLESGGEAIGVVADNLAQTANDPETSWALDDGHLCLISPFLPTAVFNTGNAMSRNKVIYTLAEFAIVVDSAYELGGTWSGAIENLRHNWVPLFVRSDPDAGAGNQHLINRGGHAFTAMDLSEAESLSDLLENRLAVDSTANGLTPSLADDSTAGPKGETNDIRDRLLEFLKDSHTTADIIRHLNTNEFEVKRLLKRAVDSGQVTRIRQRPLVYQLSKSFLEDSRDLFNQSE